jgi:DNA-binding CsgD family transcriptional regulator
MPWPGPPGARATFPPQAASFIGRRRELAEVRRKLTEARLGERAVLRRLCVFAGRFTIAKEGAIAALGATGYQAEAEAGRRLGREAAVGLALGQDQRDGSTPGTGPLARQEADVARLIADGLTNRQIGARLFISERTVDSHVRSILNKLGFSSRAQIAAWVAGPDGV